MPSSNHSNSKDSVCFERSLYGRRQGRTLSGIRSEVLETLLPEIKIQENQLPQNHTISPSSLFRTPFQNYVLEIGFGHGERLAELTKTTPDTGFIGAEPFITGMADFLKDIKDDDHTNTRVLMDDGLIIARSLTPKSIDKIYILNPDPWHKTRHHKRRIINQNNLNIFAKILKPGGELIMTSDVPNCAEWMCTQATNHPSFTWTAKTRDNWSTPPKDWVKTRYEEKGAKGAKKMVYLFFKKENKPLT